MRYRLVGLSVTSFCQEARLEVTSVLDHESCRVYPLCDVPDNELAHAPREGGLRENIGELLNVDASEPILVIRRARGFRRREQRKHPVGQFLRRYSSSRESSVICGRPS